MTSGGGGPERVHEHLHPGMLERDLHLSGGLRVDVQTGGLDDPAVEVGRKRRDVVAFQELLDEVAVLLGDQGVEVVELRFVTAAFAHVLHRHHDVDAVGLAVDMLVDPVQLDLELLGRERERAEYPETAGAADRGNDVSAVREREDGELDVELFGNRCAHCLNPLSESFVGRSARQTSAAAASVIGITFTASALMSACRPFLTNENEMPVAGSAQAT